MKILKALLPLLIISFLTTGCFEDSDDSSIQASQINDFIWKGMNVYYLYKDKIPDLANDRFSTKEEYADYLNDFSKPEDLFESLIYQRQTIDRFSWIVDDYIALEQLFSGTSTSNGMEYKIFTLPSTGTNAYGYVTYVLPNTSASNQDVKRGDIFYAVNDIQLTTDNWRSLLGISSYSINIGAYNTNSTPETSDDFIEPTTLSMALTKSEYTKNPILTHSTLNIDGTKIAYLMYNGFTGTIQFNSELNDVFGTFKSTGITELVLDLRYNPGGAVDTAVLLSSMITGQFTGDIFSTEQWNSELQEIFENRDPELLINRFTNNNNGTALNSLNLDRVYILTTKSSASASELVINSLKPYIDVVQIGTNTAGKYQASTTLYDSPDFGRQGANQNHSYAMQPLIYKSLNAVGFTDYFNGLAPNIPLEEQVYNLGVLGDINEPLLAAAISNIMGTGRLSTQKGSFPDIVGDSNDLIPHSKEMVDDNKIPIDIIKRISFE